MASDYELFNILNQSAPVIHFFSSRSGVLPVTKRAGVLFLDFPTDFIAPIEGLDTTITACINVEPKAIYKGKTDLLVVVDNEVSVRHLQSNLAEIAKLKARGIIVTAKGDSVDFVSRFFVLHSGIDEDPVTGSAHTSLIPYWSVVLGKNKLTAQQISKRGGQLFCELNQERCLIGGQAKLYLKGEIYLD